MMAMARRGTRSSPATASHQGPERRLSRTAIQIVRSLVQSLTRHASDTHPRGFQSTAFDLIENGRVVLDGAACAGQLPHRALQVTEAELTQSRVKVPARALARIQLVAVDGAI